MTNAALLRHLAAHPYRDEVVAFLQREAARHRHLWRWSLLGIAREIEKEGRR